MGTPVCGQTPTVGEGWLAWCGLSTPSLTLRVRQKVVANRAPLATIACEVLARADNAQVGVSAGSHCAGRRSRGGPRPSPAAAGEGGRVDGTPGRLPCHARGRGTGGGAADFFHN